MQGFKNWMQQKEKPWKATRDEFLKHWTQIREHQPLAVKPITPDHHGTRYGQDGIRITGSFEFINSVLSRIKDLLHYEGGMTKLDVELRQVEAKYQTTPQDATYVAYIYVSQHSPKVSKLKSPI